MVAVLVTRSQGRRGDGRRVGIALGSSWWKDSPFGGCAGNPGRLPRPLQLRGWRDLRAPGPAGPGLSPVPTAANFGVLRGKRHKQGRRPIRFPASSLLHGECLFFLKQTKPGNPVVTIRRWFLCRGAFHWRRRVGSSHPHRNRRLIKPSGCVACVTHTQAARSVCSINYQAKVMPRYQTLGEFCTGDKGLCSSDSWWHLTPEPDKQ